MSTASAIPDRPWTRSDTSARWRVGGRYSIPHLLVGVLLVLACAVGGVLWSLAAGDRQRVLALARAVSVGQVLSTADLCEVSIATDPAMSTMAASQVSTVVGRTLATSLPAGSLLTPDMLGTPLVLSAGQAITALALKPGMFPPELTPGARVAVVFVPSLATGPSSSFTSPSALAPWQAIVTGVMARADDQVTVVSLQLPEAAARQVAAVPAGQLSLVMLSGSGG